MCESRSGEKSDGSGVRLKDEMMERKECRLVSKVGAFFNVAIVAKSWTHHHWQIIPIRPSMGPCRGGLYFHKSQNSTPIHSASPL